MIWVDETGINRYVYRENVKAKRGQVVEGKISGKRFIRQSIIAGLNSENKLVAPMIYTGTANREVIEVWLKEFLLPTLKEKSIIILDNASVHKVASVRKLIEEAGHQIIYLPPYSPQLNPIEHKWHQLKQNLRGYYDTNLDFLPNLCKQINKLTSIL